MAALGRTYRWRAEGAEPFDAIARAGQQPIMAFWHGRILPATLFFRDRGIVVITSANFDGEWIAAIIERFGYGTARGSSSRGGARALVQLTRADGAGASRPRSPSTGRAARREVAQPGAVFLAQVTGQPIVPFHIEAASAWTAQAGTGRWCPSRARPWGSRSASPTSSPTASDEAGRDAACRDLEARLAALEPRARGLVTAGASGT